jgi:hypothetical protein
MQLLQEEAVRVKREKAGSGRYSAPDDTRGGRPLRLCLPCRGMLSEPSEEHAMLMLVTGIVIGFLVSTAVFAGMARIETY